MKKIIFLLLLICCFGCSESTTDMNEGTAQQMYNSIKGTYAGNIMVDNIPQKINIIIGKSRFEVNSGTICASVVSMESTRSTMMFL